MVWEDKEKVKSKDWIFVSDAHLSGNEPGEIERFLSFLKTERDRIGCLVLLGDIFEFFFGFKPSIWNKKGNIFSDYLPVFYELQNFYHEGIKIKYYEGNHDFFLNSFFSKQFNMEIEVYTRGSEEVLDGKKVYIEHGDLSNTEDYWYRIFRRTLKNKITYQIIQFAGPSLSRRVARIINKRSYCKFHLKSPLKPPRAFYHFARKKFLEGFDIVILGHSHFPEKREEILDNKKFIYFNVGDWHTHKTFLRYSPPDQFFLERWASG